MGAHRLIDQLAVDPRTRIRGRLETHPNGLDPEPANSVLPSELVAFVERCQLFDMLIELGEEARMAMLHVEHEVKNERGRERSLEPFPSNPGFQEEFVYLALAFIGPVSEGDDLQIERATDLKVHEALSRVVRYAELDEPRRRGSYGVDHSQGPGFEKRLPY